MSKAIIPSTSLYTPHYVGSSPYAIDVTNGKTNAVLSYAFGAGMISATVGKIAEF